MGEREREREREKKWELASSQKRRISNSSNNPIKFFSDSLVLGAGQLTKCKNSTLKTKGFFNSIQLKMIKKLKTKKMKFWESL